MLASWPDVPLTSGDARVSGHVSGPLGSPALALHGTSERMVFAGIETKDLRVDTTISGDGVAVEHASFAALGGRFEGALAIPSGATRPDRANLKWRGVDVAALLRAVESPVRATARADGSATLGGQLGDPRTWQLDAVSRLSGADGVAAAVRGEAHLTLTRGAWSLSLSRGHLGTTEAIANLRGHLPPAGDRAVLRSPLQGTATLKAADVAAALTWATEAGVPVPNEIRDLVTGPVGLDLALDGTVGKPVVSTRFAQQALNVRGLGTVTLDGPVQLTGGSALSSDGLSARVGNGRLLVAGSAAFPGTLALDVDGRDIDLVSLGRVFDSPDWFPRTGTLSAKGRLAGTTALPVATLDASARDVELFGQHFDAVVGPVRISGREIRSDGLALQSGEGRASVRGSADLAHDLVDLTMSATSFPLRPITLTADDTRRDSQQPPSPSTIDIAGTADLSLAVSGTLSAPRGAGRLAVTDLKVEGTQPGTLEADLTFDGDGYGRVELEVPSVNGHATGRVGVVRPWRFDVTAAFDGTDIARAAEIGGLKPETVADITGTVAMNLRATGDLDHIADADLLVSLNRFEGTVYTLPLRLDAPAEVHANATEVSTDGLDVVTGATRARLQGRLTRDASAGALTLHADGALDDLAPLIARLSGTKATATGTVHVRGDRHGHAGRTAAGRHDRSPRWRRRTAGPAGDHGRDPRGVPAATGDSTSRRRAPRSGTAWPRCRVRCRCTWCRTGCRRRS